MIIWNDLGRTKGLNLCNIKARINLHILGVVKLTRALHTEANACLLSLNAVKGHDFVQKPYRVMPLGQIAALVIVHVH